MPVKFSQIPVSSTPPVYGTDYVVGVSGSNVDFRYPAGAFSQASVIDLTTTLIPAVNGSVFTVAHNDPGNHIGDPHAMVLLQARPVGGGENGPFSADTTLYTYSTKLNYPVRASTVHGELDGVYVQLRQTGPTDGDGGVNQSDAVAYLANIYSVGKVGFNAAAEFLVGNIADDTTTVLKELDVQIGVVNDRAANAFSYGFVASSNVGALDAAYLANTDGGTWQYGLRTTAGSIANGGYFLSADNFFSVDYLGQLIGKNATFNTGAAPGAIKLTNDGANDNILTLNGAGFPNAIGLAAEGNSAFHYTQSTHFFYTNNYVTATLDTFGWFRAYGALGTSPPFVATAASVTVDNNSGYWDSGLICNRAGTITLTLPSAASFPGRWLPIRTITNNAVVSANSDVVPLIGGAAGTAILAATAGKWALLWSDNINWQIMMAN